MLKIDIKKDWEEHIRAKFIELGFTYNENESLKNNSITFHRIIRRIVPSLKRKVYISKECTVPFIMKNGFDEIIRRFENGEDLKPYQSRLTKKSDINDLLLNDWAIHHFHLGDSLESDGYISRTGPLLYAMVTKDSAYLIAVLRHGQWTNKDLVQILHNNWKEMMNQFVIQSSPEHLTIEQRKTLRNKHANTVITASDGTTYCSPGGGIMSSGDCFFDIYNSDKIFFEIEKWESIVESNIDNFYKGANISKDEDIEIKMKFEEMEFYLYEPNKKIKFDINLKN
jgi:hypothetical protein